MHGRSSARNLARARPATSRPAEVRPSCAGALHTAGASPLFGRPRRAGQKGGRGVCRCGTDGATGRGNYPSVFGNYLSVFGNYLGVFGNYFSILGNYLGVFGNLSGNYLGNYPVVALKQAKNRIFRPFSPRFSARTAPQPAVCPLYDVGTQTVDRMGAHFGPLQPVRGVDQRQSARHRPFPGTRPGYSGG